MQYETVESYATRVRDANRISKTVWVQWLKPYALVLGHDPRRTSADLLEQVTGIARGHFARTAEMLPSHEDGASCVHCTTGLNDRYGCTRCSGGTEVIEEAHDGSRVCRRHSRWVGPGTVSDAQFQVGANIIKADRVYRKLRADGVLDAHRLAEILGWVDLWVEAETLALDAAQRFEVAVRLAARVLRPGRIAAAERDPATRYAELDAVVSTVVNESAAVLVDGIWHLLRTAAHAGADLPVEPGDPADWRRTAENHTSFEDQGDVNADIANGAIAIAGHFELGYSSQDWVETFEGRIVLLDVNPSGQWLFLPERVGEEVAMALADRIAGAI
ncbi:hypothetical protein [Microbacterium sp. NPDC055665]